MRGARSNGKTQMVRTKYIPVLATVNGQEARVTLVPAGGGRYRMQLNTALRKAARADAGDEVSVTLRLDRESREPAVPADLRAALKENPEARKVFEKLTTGHRRHIVDWFDSARGVDTRIRRLGFTIDFLLKRAQGGSMSRRGRKRPTGKLSSRKLPGLGESPGATSKSKARRCKALVARENVGIRRRQYYALGRRREYCYV